MVRYLIRYVWPHITGCRWRYCNVWFTAALLTCEQSCVCVSWICLSPLLKASLFLFPCYLVPLSTLSFTPIALTRDLIHLKRSVSCRYLLHSLCLYGSLYLLTLSAPPSHFRPSACQLALWWLQPESPWSPLEVCIGQVITVRSPDCRGAALTREDDMRMFDVWFDQAVNELAQPMYHSALTSHLHFVRFV